MNRRNQTYRNGMGPNTGAGVVMGGPQGNWANTTRSKNMMPTGGSVAQKMKMSPYALPGGGFRKPRQDEIITEIKLFTGVGLQAQVDRVDGFDNFPQVRHICVIKPYLHFLLPKSYMVTLPDIGPVPIQYLVHACGKLIINKQTMP